MRSKNFVSRSGKTNLRGNREKKIEKRTNWDRIVYLIFLGILVVIFGYIFVEKFFFVTGKGFLMNKNLEVRAPENLKISTFYVSARDSIGQGKKLFDFIKIDNSGNSIQDSIAAYEHQLAMEKQIDPLKNKTALLRREIAILRENLSFYSNREQEILNKIKLDIATNHDLLNVQDEKQNISIKIRMKQAELSTLNFQQKEIQSKFKAQDPRITGLGRLNDKGSITEYFSPIEGVVDEIFVPENEMIFESEPIMSIKIKSSEVFIISKFDRKEAKYLLPGTVLQVKFANGERSKGVVRKNYVPQNNSRVQKDQYKDDVQLFIAVNLYPIDETEAKVWKNNQEMSVEVWRSIF